jgi:hypothetical protein
MAVRQTASRESSTKVRQMRRVDCLHWHAEFHRSIPKQTRSTLFHDHLQYQRVDELGVVGAPSVFGGPVACGAFARRVGVFAD